VMCLNSNFAIDDFSFMVYHKMLGLSSIAIML
jgi:hypothetical protein